MLTFIVKLSTQNNNYFLKHVAIATHLAPETILEVLVNGFHGKVLLLLDSYLLSIKYCLSARPAGSFRTFWSQENCRL